MAIQIYERHQHGKLSKLLLLLSSDETFSLLGPSFQFPCYFIVLTRQAAILLCAHLWQYSIVYFHFYFFSWDRE